MNNIENGIVQLQGDLNDLSETVDGMTGGGRVPELVNEMAQLKNDFNLLEENYGTTVDEIYTDVEYTDYDPQFTDGAVDTDGTIISSSSYTSTYEYSVKIPVMEGDVVGLINSGSPTPSYRWLCAYNSNQQAVPSAGKSSGSTLPYTVPSGIAYVVLSVYKSHSVTAIRITHTSIEEITRYFPIFQQLGKFNWEGNLTDGDSILLTKSNVRFIVVWVFTGHVSTMAQISIGIKQTNSFTVLAEVDNTYLYYRGNASGDITSVAHGLTISDDIQIKVVSDFRVNTLKSITITSGGINYTLAATSYGTDMNGSPCVVSDGAELEDCAFAWIPRDINKPIWIFGDSWASMFDTRWVYYMVEAGFDKSWMLNAYAGENTQTGLESFKNLLYIRKPEYVVWMYGMNNSDSIDSVNSDWKTAYDELIQICEDYKITPILYTVPNTPSVNNNYKNAIVKTSGYRYIDGVSAVGDDGSGNWFTGYEQSESDHNHTSAKGAIALFNRILTDFPEIASN